MDPEIDFLAHDNCPNADRVDHGDVIETTVPIMQLATTFTDAAGAKLTYTCGKCGAVIVVHTAPGAVTADSEYRRGVVAAERGEAASPDAGHWFSRGFAWMSAMLDRQRLTAELKELRPAECPLMTEDERSDTNRWVAQPCGTLFNTYEEMAAHARKHETVE